MALKSTVARETARFLASRGIKRVYGIPGGEVTHLIDALENEFFRIHTGTTFRAPLQVDPIWTMEAMHWANFSKNVPKS